MWSAKWRPFCLSLNVLIASSSEDLPVSLCLIYWSLGDLDVISKMKFSILFYWLLPSDTAFL